MHCTPHSSLGAWSWSPGCGCLLWLLKPVHQDDPWLFPYSKFWAGCTKAEVKNELQRTRLIQDKSCMHTRLDTAVAKRLIRYYFRWRILAHSHVNSWQIYCSHQAGFGGLGVGLCVLVCSFLCCFGLVFNKDTYCIITVYQDFSISLLRFLLVHMSYTGCLMSLWTVHILKVKQWH